MSVSGTPNTPNTTAGTSRPALARTDAVRRATAARTGETEARRDAAHARRANGSDAGRGAAASRGAKAAPADAAAGQRSVMAVPPSASTAVAGGGPVTPYEASSRAYALEASRTPGAPPVAGSPVASAAGAIAGATVVAGGWTPAWQAHFQALGMNASDIEYLAGSGMSYDELVGISEMVQAAPPVEQPVAGHAPSAAAASIAPSASTATPADPAPIPNVDAAEVASADAPTTADLAPAGQPGMVEPTSAFTPQWEARFTDLMRRMGVPASQVAAQIEEVRAQPASELQLQQVWQQMQAAVGDFDASWHAQFSSVLRKLETPAAERDQVLQQLASSGLTTAQLEQAYAQMEAGLPGWNNAVEAKFRELGLPPEMVDGIKAMEAPRAALQQKYEELAATRAKYEQDGRLKRLEKAKATPAETWDAMVQGMAGKEFDTYVEQVHSRHVSGWRRAGSIALNLIPGVYTAQYLTGKDWVTGEKIDRTNPLNIVGAVASGFAGVAAARTGATITRNLIVANRTAAATMAAGKAGALAQSVATLGSASPMGQGALQAIEAAGLLPKFQAGLKMTDYLKAATPIVNRFGEAGRLSAVGRGYGQGMHLAAGAAAMRAGEAGRVVVDPTVKATVLAKLREGRSIEEALEAAGRSGMAGGHVVHADDIAANYRRFGFVQGKVDGAVRGSGTFTFNPFRSRATVTAGGGEMQNVFTLGRSVDFGTTGGLAQGVGAVQAANGLGRTSVANGLMHNGPLATRLTGIAATDEGQRLRALERTADWARRLGVTSPSTSASNRAAARTVAMVENGGNGGYAAARTAGDMASRYGGYVAAPLVSGAVVGMAGPQMQPAWEYWRNRGEIRRSEQAAQEAAVHEQREYARMYEQQQAGGAQPAGAAPADPPAAGAGQPQVVGTSPQTGGQLLYDPSAGVVLDTTSGDVFDPSSGQLLGNLAQSQTTPGAAPAASAPQIAR